MAYYHGCKILAVRGEEKQESSGTFWRVFWKNFILCCMG